MFEPDEVPATLVRHCPVAYPAVTTTTTPAAMRVRPMKTMMLLRKKFATAIPPSGCSLCLRDLEMNYIPVGLDTHKRNPTNAGGLLAGDLNYLRS